MNKPANSYLLFVANVLWKTGTGLVLAQRHLAAISGTITETSGAATDDATVVLRSQREREP